MNKADRDRAERITRLLAEKRAREEKAARNAREAESELATKKARQDALLARNKADKKAKGR
jgi:hypothetical protein